MKPIVLILLAFLAGALPFGLWLGYLVRRIDVREHGSGNLGATNVFRVLGPGWGILTLIADIGKGWLAVALLPGWLDLGSVASGALWPLAAALAAIAGHIATPFAGFRGGKGVATALGCFVGLAPVAALIAVFGWLAAVLITRFVSVGSLVLALLFPLAALIWGPPAPLRWGVVIVGGLIAVLIAWRHRANWRRIAAGEEGRFSWRNR